jgi:glycosyltransferase involved in cell wall biosynthesis
MTTVVYAATAGAGGLGLQAATAIAGLATAGPVVALGPGCVPTWPLETPPPTGVSWCKLPPFRPSWFARHVVRRLRPGVHVLAHDRHLGQAAAARLAEIRANLVYAFTQVGLESLEWARGARIPTVLDNPNGHIRGFAEVYRTEAAKWTSGRYHGHPCKGMIDRVEREYALADRIRVSSEFAKASLVARGVPHQKVFMCPQPINRQRFHPAGQRLSPTGPLRVCYAGSLDLRKGFLYLLQALHRVGPGRARLEIVGATGDRQSRRIFARETAGLDVIAAPGDPIPAYQRAELLVLPSLEDGFGFVVPEAMACGLPVVVTDQCGAAEWVRTGETGWVVPARDLSSLAGVLEIALANRDRLPAMGDAARREIERRDPDAALRQLASAVLQIDLPSVRGTGSMIKRTLL